MHTVVMKMWIFLLLVSIYLHNCSGINSISYPIKGMSLVKAKTDSTQIQTLLNYFFKQPWYSFLYVQVQYFLIGMFYKRNDIKQNFHSRLHIDTLEHTGVALQFAGYFPRQVTT